MFVYCDNAATAPLRREAFEAMRPWLEDNFGNASSIYRPAREAKKALEEARRSVAENLGVKPEEVYFTSGGTEADNWALKSAAEAAETYGRKHFITTAMEHHAVLHTLQYLEKKRGCEVTYLSIDKTGAVNPDDLRAALRPDTALVSIMAANNEIGTVLPVAEFAAIVKQYDKKILFHTDAVQAVGHIPLEITPDIDLLSLSGHKFGGPKGVGALIMRRSANLPPLLHGGGHERGKRSSTENVAGIAGMAAALRVACADLAQNVLKTSAQRDKIIARVLSEIPYSRLTGAAGKDRLPGSVSFVFECIEGESMVLSLDARGVCASSGSACSSGSLDPSHVLLALGLPHEIAHGSLRLSIDESLTEEQLDYVVDSVKAVVERCRLMSPLWDETEQKPLVKFD